MMRGRAWIFVGGAGLALALLGQADFLSPVLAAAITVGSTVVLALLAHGGLPLASEAVAMGAGGALAYEATRAYIPLLASGLLLAFVFGTRAMRSRNVRELVFHVGLAFAGGIAASWVTRANQGLEVTLWLTAITVAALLASIPWLVPTDAPRTFALRRVASRARGPLRFSLLRAVVAHRALMEIELPQKLRRRVERTFDDVIRRAERCLERDGRRDDELGRIISQLQRVSRAAGSRDALLDGLESSAARGLAAESDALEAEVAALVELG